MATLKTSLQNLLSGWIPSSLKLTSFGEEQGVYTRTDNVNLVINKLNEAFTSGELINPPKGMVKPNKMTTWLSLETRFYDEFKRESVGYLFCKDTIVFLLESEYLELDFKTNATIFNTETFMEAVKSAHYTTNNKRVDLLLEEGEIVPVYDIGMDSNFQPIRRLDQIKDTCELSHRTTRALIGAMTRTALAFISKKLGDRIKAPLDKTDQKVQKDREKFQEDFDLTKGGIKYSNQPLEIIEANPDNKKLQGLEIDTHSLKKISTQLGCAHTLIFEDAKYDNATVYVLMMYDQTTIPDSEKFYTAINERYGTTMYRDYTTVKQTLIESYDTNSGADKENQEGSQEEAEQ